MTFEFEGSRNIIFQQITYLFENCKQCITISIKPYLSRTQLQPLRTYLFRCSLVRFTIKNTYSVIFRLVCSVFHLLFRYFNLLRKYNLAMSKLKVKLHLQREFHVHRASRLRLLLASKNPIFLKIKNKHFYSPYSNEILHIKALEYKEYFTHIDLWWILKNSQDI